MATTAESVGQSPSPNTTAQRPVTGGAGALDQAIKEANTDLAKVLDMTNIDAETEEISYTPTYFSNHENENDYSLNLNLKKEES